jgi:hypothetical protein
MSESRRGLLLPVTVAALALSVTGAAVGLALGGRRSSPPAAPVAAASAPSVAATVAGVPVRQMTEPEACPAATSAAAKASGARGSLTMVAEFTARLSVVRVCADTRGRLFLHGNRPPPEDRWVPGETPLVPDPVARGDGFVARSTDDNLRTTTLTADPVEFRLEEPYDSAPTHVQTMVAVRRWGPPVASSPRPVVVAAPAPVTETGVTVPCDPNTQGLARKAGAVGILYVLAEFRTDRSLAWICTDDRDRHFLHTRRSVDGDAWEEGGNTFFVADPATRDGAWSGTWTGADGGHVVTLAPAGLRIEHPLGWREEEPVQSVERFSEDRARSSAGPPVPRIKAEGRPVACPAALRSAATRLGASGSLHTVLRVRPEQWTVDVCVDASERLFLRAAERDGPALVTGEVVAHGDGYRARHTDGRDRVTTFETTLRGMRVWRSDGTPRWYEMR